MATCKSCHKSGIFLRVGNTGCCDKCTKTIKESIQIVEHEISSNTIYLQDPVNSEDLNRIIKDLTENYEELAKYKKLGFVGKISDPQDALNMLIENHDKYYVHLAKQEGQILIDQLNKMVRKKYQFKKVQDFLDSFEDEYDGMKDKTLLNPIRKKFEKLKESYLE